MLWIIMVLYACTVLVALGVFSVNPESDHDMNVLPAVLWPVVLLISFGIFLAHNLIEKKNKPNN